MTNTNDPNAEVRAVLAQDGVDFINIYSNGKTSLGRQLSHFARTPFIHPHYGPFDSMEGFWYWLRSDVRDDRLRTLSGKEAKQHGKQLPSKFYPEFWEDILAADYQKIKQHPQLAQMLADSVLPFRHFYVFYPPTRSAEIYERVTSRPSRQIIIDARDGDKLCDGMVEIRNAIREDRPTTHWEAAEKRYIARISNEGKA